MPLALSLSLSRTALSSVRHTHTRPTLCARELSELAEESKRRKRRRQLRMMVAASACEDSSAAELKGSDAIGKICRDMLNEYTHDGQYSAMCQNPLMSWDVYTPALARRMKEDIEGCCAVRQAVDDAQTYKFVLLFYDSVVRSHIALRMREDFGRRTLLCRGELAPHCDWTYFKALNTYARSLMLLMELGERPPAPPRVHWEMLGASFQQYALGRVGFGTVVAAMQNFFQ